jgi:hypothetical protein
MDNSLKVNYLKRTQRDYSYAFKLQVVGEIERGELAKGRRKKSTGYSPAPPCVNGSGNLVTLTGLTS